MKYIKFVVITFCLMACQQCLKESDFEIMTIEKSHNDEVGISDTTIVAPIGYFIIIKKNDKYCALKIHEYGKHRTKYYDSYVKYDYYQSDSSGNFFKKNSKNGYGISSRCMLPIYGRLSFNLCNEDMLCGDIHLRWIMNNSISLENSSYDEKYKKSSNDGVEIAPTKWKTIKEVDVFFEKLKWFKYDTSRKKGFIIPVDSLW